MNIEEIEQIIHKKFEVKPNDVLPSVGVRKNADRVLLAELFADLQFNCGAEIGVEFGRFSEVLCTKNSNLHLFCIDPWCAYHNTSNRASQKAYDLTVRRLSKYNVEIIRKKSMDAVHSIKDNSLDFIYIDALHEFDAVMLDLIYWIPKVKIGGIISGHDFCHLYQFGVIRAVEAYVNGHNINPWYLTSEQYPSYFWVNKVKPIRYW